MYLSKGVAHRDSLSRSRLWRCHSISLGAWTPETQQMFKLQYYKLHRQKIITLLPQENLSMDSTHCYRCFIPHEGPSKYYGCWTQTERNSLVSSDCNMLSISLMSSIFSLSFQNKYLHQFNLLSLFFLFFFFSLILFVMVALTMWHGYAVFLHGLQNQN